MKSNLKLFCSHAGSSAAGSCWRQEAKMTVHNIYIFDRNGSCLFYNEWNRKKQAGISKEEEFKLMYGMLFSIRSFVSKMSPLDMKDGFLSFQTMNRARETLQHIYSNLYVELVVKNPACSPAPSLDSELFCSRLDAFIRSLPFFSPRAA
ncbi:hypothetical protein OJAV_G00185580 [Oryzias javanicus]|uniref:Trafficking protein particle complex subunit n=1 Tax=Oryzias javanicus TaxID=123683 RepID=A0A437CFF7_ORYJA|nr:hypothetical protein OJAV_G00185580 [Oryzias javanicus]